AATGRRMVTLTSIVSSLAGSDEALRMAASNPSLSLARPEPINLLDQDRRSADLAAAYRFGGPLLQQGPHHRCKRVADSARRSNSAAGSSPLIRCSPSSQAGVPRTP